MCLQVLPLDGQRHICEGFCVQQLVEDGQKVALVVVPPQAEALRCHLHWEAVVASLSDVRVCAIAIYVLMQVGHQRSFRCPGFGFLLLGA